MSRLLRFHLSAGSSGHSAIDHDVTAWDFGTGRRIAGPNEENRGEGVRESDRHGVLHFASAGRANQLHVCHFVT